MKLKIINKIVSLGTVATLMFNLPLTNVNATSNFVFTYELKEVLSNCTVNYSTEYANNYSVYTLCGATAWHSDKLLFTLNWSKTNSSNYTAFCKTTNTAEEGILAYTIFLSDTKAGEIDPNSNDWNSSIIYVNKNMTVPVTTFIHEFGHVMGLAHNNSNPSSIMCQSAYGRTATMPSDFDLSLLSLKYNDRD